MDPFPRAPPRDTPPTPTGKKPPKTLPRVPGPHLQEHEFSIAGDKLPESQTPRPGTKPHEQGFVLEGGGATAPAQNPTCKEFVWRVAEPLLLPLPQFGSGFWSDFWSDFWSIFPRDALRGTLTFSLRGPKPHVQGFFLEGGGATAPAQNPTCKEFLWRVAEPLPRPKTPRAKIFF